MAPSRTTGHVSRFAVLAGLILAVTVATPALGVRRPRKPCKRSTLKSCQLDRSTFTACVSPVIFPASDTALTLTPLEIKTSGVLTADPVTATFSDGAGYSVTTPAISVTSGGTLTVPVPLYVAPSTHNVASGQVSIVLTQDGQ